MMIHSSLHQCRRLRATAGVVLQSLLVISCLLALFCRNFQLATKNVFQNDDRNVELLLPRAIKSNVMNNVNIPKPSDVNGTTNGTTPNSIPIVPSPSISSTPRILLYITTIFSQPHQDFFTCCWPLLMEKSKMLPNIDVVVFSNNATELDASELAIAERLFARKNPNFRFQFATPQQLSQIERQPRLDSLNRFQMGANLGMALGVSNGWFDPYDWIIRINPDVLIRDSSWIWHTMHNPNVDGIFVNCSANEIHTDFLAVRPSALSRDAFTQMRRYRGSRYYNHELTAFYEVQSILRAGRYRLLPGTKNSNGMCRVRGARSPIYHGHDSCIREAKTGGGGAQMKCTPLEKFARMGMEVK